MSTGINRQNDNGESHEKYSPLCMHTITSRIDCQMRRGQYERWLQGASRVVQGTIREMTRITYSMHMTFENIFCWPRVSPFYVSVYYFDATFTTRSSIVW